MRKIQVAKRIAAGLLVSGALTFGVAAAASAQSGPSGPSGATSTTTTLRQVTTTTTVAVGSSRLAQTGTDMWIPLAAGGGATAIALAARRARRSIV